LSSEGYFVAQAISVGLRSVLLLLCGYLAGTVITPVLLPYVPGRSFSAKGAWVGFVLVLVLLLWKGFNSQIFDDWLNASAWLLIIPAIASFLAMNFTGSSTFTSLSGVRREMRVAVPLQIAGSVAGIGLWITSRFI
jgi:acetyl-CoA decarbonylase/synthase complex subunit gamma